MLLRPVKPMVLPGIKAAKIEGPVPTLITVDPTRLMVDGAYQRNLSERSIRLIRKIIQEWDWKAFKPPIVTEADGSVFHILDGQHTAIAAATHPAIKEIPALVVNAGEPQGRADAFVRHNRDRIAVTANQLHFALLEAQDPEALTIQAACDDVGVKILKNPPSNGRFNSGQTMAVQTLRSIEKRRHRAGLRRILQICHEARLAPVAMHHLRAVEELLFGTDFKGVYADTALAATLRHKNSVLEREADIFRTAHRIPLWRAFAIQLGKNTRKSRGSG